MFSLKKYRLKIMIYTFVFIFGINLPVSVIGILELDISGNVRIVGGKNVSISTIPYQVSIRDSFNNHFCGGTIIDNYNVLTAAHCYDSHKKERLFCALDATTLNDGNLYAVKSVTVFPKYDSVNIINDIAILHMAKRMEFNNKTSSPIALAIKTPPVNSNCTVSGWGSEVPPIRADMALPSFYLRAATVPIFSKKECVETYHKNLSVTLKQQGILCAGFEDGKSDSCQGDSGGPLVCNGSLSGIISWGFSCALPGIPGIYTDVAQYRTWVINNLSKSGSSMVNSTMLMIIIVPVLLILITSIKT